MTILELENLLSKVTDKQQKITVRVHYTNGSGREYDVSAATIEFSLVDTSWSRVILKTRAHSENPDES